ncbi:interleukin-5 receptor subunit alpha isoform X2 [Xenopus laevis]|uniref:Interleukin-5 receptor subunit alpha isoform X2 n=1 Tax=Xenopus laevis TaxID=8355 RepID=A0A8J1M9E3_XENLA|nr:interleukin-5 receptor subunit alpha isoform X2 [Xenopus laevis]
MDVKYATSVIWMIIVQLPLHLSFVHKDLLPHPANLTLQILNRSLQLSWDCNALKELSNITEFWISVKAPHEKNFTPLQEVKCSAGETKLELQTHVTLKVDIQINEKTTHFTREIVVIPEGMEETAASNATCELYVTSMRCYWNFGKNAPDDTNYTLLLIQNNSELQCQHYENDQQRRTGKCEIPDLKINEAEMSTILLEGNNKKDIQIYAKRFEPLSKEVFQPPTNISLIFTKNEVEFYWSQPKTFYTAANHCFKYQMQDSRGNIEPDIDAKYTYKKDISSFQEECPLRMRARGKDTCYMDTNWGEWSEELKCGPVPPSSAINIITYTAIAAAVIIACLVLLLLCMRSCKLLFPAIPHPRKYSLKPTNQEKELDNENLKCKQMIPILESEEPDVICLEN